MNITLELTLSIDNQNHVNLAKWLEKATNEEILGTLVSGYIISTNTLYQNNDLINTLKKEHEQEIRILTKQHSEYREQWLNKYENLINSTKDQEIQTLKHQLSLIQNSNSYKGQYGEKTIESILSNHFMGYEIKNTSMSPNMSDIHLTDKEGFTIAIECKNKACISTQDVVKSMNDIKSLKSKIHGYFFVSLRCRNIPRKGDLLYEIIDDIPVIWYGNEDTNTLENDIIHFIKILTMHRGHTVDEQSIVANINTYIKKISDVNKSIDQISNQLTNMKNTLASTKNIVEWLYDDLSKYLKTEIYSCSYCNMQYKRKCDLSKHINQKHSNSDK